MSYPVATPPTFLQDNTLTPYIRTPAPAASQPPQPPKLPASVAPKTTPVESTKEQLDALKTRRLNDLKAIIKECDTEYNRVNTVVTYDNYLFTAIGVLWIASVILLITAVSIHSVPVLYTAGALTLIDLGLALCSRESELNERARLYTLFNSLVAQQEALKPFRNQEYCEAFVAKTVTDHPETVNFYLWSLMNIPPRAYPEYD